MTPPDLTDDQRTAVECDRPNILVVAGAGTGKTKTTTARYARLIANGLEPSHILVFTFTEKAANELRSRIRKVSAGSERKLSISSAWVGTFHSICARILRAHPIAADVDPTFRVLDEVQSERLKDESWEAALATITDSPERLDVISRFSPYVLRPGIENVWEKLRSFGSTEPALPPLPENRPDPRTLAIGVSEAAVAAESTPRIRQTTKDRIKGIIDGIAAFPPDRDPTWEEVNSLCPEGLPKSVSDLQADLDRLIARVAESAFGAETYTVLNELLVAYGAELTRRKNLAGALDFEDLQLMTLDLLKRHPAIAGIYKQQFAEIMVDEFQDTNPLQVELIETLRGEGTTLFTVGDEMQAIYGFRHADIQLFQDRRDELCRSDPDAVLSLSANFRSGGPIIGAVNEIGRRVTGGGQEPVSHHFQELVNGKDRGPERGDEVELIINEAGAWSEFDLGGLSPLPEASADGASDRPKGAGQHEAEALALAHRIRETVERKEFRPGQIAILFRGKSRMWIFEQALRQVGIPAHVAGGTGFWDTREGVDLRGLLAALANPLDDDSLLGLLAGPACGLSSSALWKLAAARRTDRDEARDLGREAAADGTGRWSRLPLWNVVQDPAAVGVELAESDRTRTEVTVAVINDLRHRAGLMPLGELVEAAVTRTGYDLVSLLRDPSGAGLVNIRRVASLAAGFETENGRDLRGLVDWIDLSKRLDSEAAVSTQDESTDEDSVDDDSPGAVRLMTIHKSKGLEFGMVCLADMGRPRRTDTESAIWVGRDPGDRKKLTVGINAPVPGSDDTLKLFDWGQLSQASNEASADEELRLLHVALTRAERRLLLSGTIPLGEVPSISATSSHLARLAAAFELGADEPEPLPIPAPGTLPEAGIVPAESEIRVEFNRASTERGLELAREFALATTDPSTEPDRIPPLARPDLPSLPDVPLSYSALGEFADCPARFFARRVLKLRDPQPAPGQPRGRVRGNGGSDGIHRPSTEPLDPEDRELPVDHDGSAFGSAVHRMLENSAKPNGRWIRPTDGAVSRELKVAGFDPESGDTFARARAMVDGFLESPLGQRIKGERSQTEVNLVLRFGKLMIRGYIDLALPSADPPLVLDYKTNRLDGSSPEEKMETYTLQRDLYALGIARDRRVDSVGTAYVFLESPDRPVEVIYDRDRLAAASDQIERLVGEVARGRYLGGPEALHQPCGECWACELLGPRIAAASAG
ncbi:MAG: UvrD-helicase domain-containing protein [Solirubrobacterales bacterium]|nr:UvrD-helicase domain-containing protein [Solirubrobacterales bacterium]